MNCTPKQQELLDLPAVKLLTKTFDLVTIDSAGNQGPTQAAKINSAISAKVQSWQNAFKASTSNDLNNPPNSPSSEGQKIQHTPIES